MKNLIVNKIEFLLVAILSIIAPIIPFMMTILVLIVFDFIAGIWRALKTDEAITSRKMSNTISKMVLYQIAILTLFLLEKYILLEVVPVTKIAVGFIAIIETKSILESIEIVTGVKIWNKIKNLFERQGIK